MKTKITTPWKKCYIDEYDTHEYYDEAAGEYKTHKMSKPSSCIWRRQRKE